MAGKEKSGLATSKDLLEKTMAITDELVSALSEWKFSKVKDILKPLHASDIAEVISWLDDEDRNLLIEVLKEKLTPEILLALDPCLRDGVVQQVDPEILIQMVSTAKSDDAIAILSRLDQDMQDLILGTMDLRTKNKIEKILQLPDDAVGRKMDQDFVVVKDDSSLTEIMTKIKNSRIENIYDVFMLDSEGKPKALIPISKLVKGSKAYDKNLANENIVSVNINDDIESLAYVFKKYKQLSVPVIDDSGVMEGVISIDDAFSVMYDEIEEDMLKLNSISFVDFYASIFTTVYSRFNWVVISVLSGFICAFVMSQFKDLIESNGIIASLVPLVIAIGGACGMQVTTVAVRSIATHELVKGRIMSSLFKEMMVGTLNWFLVSLILIPPIIIWFHDFRIGVLLFSTLGFSIFWGVMTGVLVPLMIDRFKLDPAIGSSPIVCATTDVLGTLVMLCLAKYFLFV